MKATGHEIHLAEQEQFVNDDNPRINDINIELLNLVSSFIASKHLHGANKENTHL